MMVTEDNNNNKTTTEENDDTSIPEEDIGATVVMTGLPVSLDMQNEKARASLDSFFEECGTIKRVIFQEDGGQQHAVVVFNNVESIGPAVAKSNTIFLGATVNIVSAAGLGPDSEISDGKQGGNNGTQSSGNRRRSIGTLVKSSVASAIATGFVFSTTVDNKYNITNTVSKKVSDIDKAYKVTEAVNDLTNIARTHASSIDNQYGISKKTKEIGSNIHEQANSLQDWLIGPIETVQETRDLTKEKINEKLPVAETVIQGEVVDSNSGGSLLTTEIDDTTVQDGALAPDDETVDKAVPL